MRVIFSILFVFISLNSVNSQSGKSILQHKKMIIIPKGESKKNIYNSPVVNVSWFADQAYCNWKQKRLPTLAQWELAGSAAPKNVKYTSVASYILHWYEKPALPVLPNIKTTYINSYGLFDMHGLIWEWAFDFN